jgi:protein O-mannosyl-transferase
VISLCLVLFVLVGGAFLPSLSNDFINYDDEDYVTSNVHVQRGLNWENLGWALRSTDASNWHPVTWLSHMADCQLHGLKPWGHHLTSVVLHAANTVLLFLILRRMTRTVWRSVWVAALFGLHPLRVESVVWVAERKDVLSGLFFLLTVLAYAKYAESRVQNPNERKRPWGSKCAEIVTREEGRSNPDESELGSQSAPHTLPAAFWYGLSLVFFALGLMSKPMLVTVPFVLLLLDYWPLQRWQGGRVLNLLAEKIPFLAFTVVSSLVTFLVQRRGGAVVEAGLPLWARMENGLVSCCRYLGKLFWPVDLCVSYPHPASWPPGTVALSGLVLLGVSVLVVRWRHRQRYLPVGWFWFLGTLVPVIGLVQVGAQAMADRYTYIPMIGVLVLIVWGARDLTQRWWYRGVILPALAVTAALICLVLTRENVSYWRNAESLFRRALMVNQENFMAHTLLGNVLERQGRLDEAIGHYQQALRLKPYSADANNGLGVALAAQGLLDEAVKRFERAVGQEPGHAEAHNNLGLTLARQGRLDPAISQLREALRLKPDYMLAHHSLGASLARAGFLDEAIVQYQEALSLKPNSAETHNSLGIALGRKGLPEQAMRHFQAAIRLNPDYADAHFNLGVAFGKNGDLEGAIGQYQQAIKINPDYAGAHNNLGIALSAKGRFDEAIRHYQEALRRLPDDAATHNNLGVALCKKGRLDEAIPHLQQALRLKPDYAEAQNNLRAALNLKAAAATAPIPSTRP